MPPLPQVALPALAAACPCGHLLAAPRTSPRLDTGGGWRLTPRTHACPGPTAHAGRQAHGARLLAAKRRECLARRQGAAWPSRG